MTAEAVVLITQVCSAILGVAAVLALTVRVFLSPRIKEVDSSLKRIEAHLKQINGTVGRMNEWEHQHELDHARAER